MKEKNIVFTKIRSKIATSYIAWFFYRFNFVRGFIYLYLYRFIFHTFNVGKNPKVWGKFFIFIYEPKNSKIEIGNNLWLVSGEGRSGITFYSHAKLTTIGSGQIKIGNNVALNGTVITSKKNIQIGDNCMIAPNVIIVDTDFHLQWPPEQRFQQVPSKYDKSIFIKSNVWIGMNSIVLKGVTIGKNSIIGAGSIVTTDIPDNVIASGNPARVIKRFK